MNTILPCDSRSEASAARQTSDAPTTFVASTSCHRSASVSTRRTSGSIAVAYTTTSSPPSCSTASRTTWSQCAGTRTSHTAVPARSPAAAAASASFSARRAANTTRAPPATSCSATARPMPDDAADHEHARTLQLHAKPPRLVAERQATDVRTQRFGAHRGARAGCAHEARRQGGIHQRIDEGHRSHDGRDVRGRGRGVAVTGRSVDKGEKVAERIRDAGGDATFFRLDVSDESSVQEAIAATVERYGTITTLINNAAPTDLSARGSSPCTSSPRPNGKRSCAPPSPATCSGPRSTRFPT